MVQMTCSLGSCGTLIMLCGSLTSVGKTPAGPGNLRRTGAAEEARCGVKNGEELGG